MVPLISSLAYGPLGACQLPRTMVESTHAQRRYFRDDEYPDMTDNGLDPRVLRALNLDIETTLTYLRENMPSYLEFEAWILEQKGDAFWGFEQQDAIVRWNAFIRARRHRGEKIEETYTDTGLPRDAGIDSATVLNSLQDMAVILQARPAQTQWKHRPPHRHNRLRSPRRAPVAPHLVQNPPPRKRPATPRLSRHDG